MTPNNIKISKNIIKHALLEDIPSGDITTDLIVDNNEKAAAYIVSKEQGILCGIEVVIQVFLNVDSKLKIKKKLKDGNVIKKNQIILSIVGKKSLF
ncbi:MAG: hypothetical protein FF85_03490 [alpha proteobacterium QL1]|nr:MAG: hypothetical protein FF85_03490 [alpha proteobacterium QL1]